MRCGVLLGMWHSHMQPSGAWPSARFGGSTRVVAPARSIGGHPVTARNGRFGLGFGRSRARLAHLLRFPRKIWTGERSGKRRPRRPTAHVAWRRVARGAAIGDTGRPPVQMRDRAPPPLVAPSIREPWRLAGVDEGVPGPKHPNAHVGADGHRSRLCARATPRSTSCTRSPS